MNKKLIAIAAAMCLLFVAAFGARGMLAKGTLAVSIDSASSESTMTTGEAPAEEPVVEEPVVEEPVVEEPVAPVAEEPVVEEPLVEEPVVEEPVVEEPVVEEPVAPVAEEPVVEEPVVEEPVVEEPVVEEPVVEEPVVEEPVVEEPVVEEPVVEEPVVDEPVVDEPVVDEPVVDEPVVDEPVVDEPVVDEPVVDEPVVDEPVVDEPVVDEPVVDEPVVDEPVVDEPVVDEPVVDEPVVDEPVVDEPVVDEPVVDEPVVDEPVEEEPEIVIVAPLAVSVSATDASAGEAITASASISGGVAPYTVSLSVSLDGVTMKTETFELAEAGSVSISYTAVSAGTYSISTAVADAAGNATFATAQATAAEVYVDYKDDHKWQAKADEIDLTGDWRMDVLLIAQSQLGYTENTTDFEVRDGQNNGYTMYGEWVGNAYADWCAAFLGWCFEQAETGMDLRLASVSSWVDKMEAYGAYRGTSYMPEAGDIIFIIPRDETKIGHIGIVEYVSGDVIGTIEANVGNMADRRTYQLGEEAIGGFASMTALMDVKGVEYQGGAEAYTVVDVEDFTAYLNTDEKVNVRFGPSTETMRAAQLSGVGTPVTVTAQVEVEGTLWYLITCEDEYGTQTGYMMAKFLDGSAPVVDEEVVLPDMTVEEDEVIQPTEEPELPAEIVEWMATSEVPVTEEMLQRALNATSLESIVLEGEKLIYVRTGEVLATYNAETGELRETVYNVLVGYLDAETLTIIPLESVQGNDVAASAANSAVVL